MDSIDSILIQSHLYCDSPGNVRRPDLMTGRIGISHLYSGHHDLNGGANSFSEAFKSALKFLFALLTLGDIEKRSDTFLRTGNHIYAEDNIFNSAIFINESEFIFFGG